MEQEKKEKIAVFRFGVIFPLLEKDLYEYWGKKEKILEGICTREWEIPFSAKTSISRSTVFNWVKRYQEGGRRIEALFPQDRGDRGRMRSLDDETLDHLVRLRKENPRVSVARLVEKARSKGVFPPGKQVSDATVYRLMRLHKVEKKKKETDLRKFEVQMSNDLWQSDCMHGPRVLHEGRERKSYLFALLDDHSRLIPHGQFYLAENLENYLDCFWTALRKRGVPRKLYVDNGPSFRSHRLQLGCASLEIALSYARPYRPQGKGKIERFFRTVRSQFLPELPKSLTLDELNKAFSHYLEEKYHTRTHGGTGQAPIDRYRQDASALRRAPDHLPQYFRQQETRRVNNDRTVKLNGRLYEAPAGLIGQQVILRFENPDRIEVFLDGSSRGFLSPVNQEVNSRIKRDSPQESATRSSGGHLFETRQKEAARD